MQSPSNAPRPRLSLEQAIELMNAALAYKAPPITPRDFVVVQRAPVVDELMRDVGCAS